MICPQCRVEYRRGFTRCADCEIDLVEDLSAVPAAALPGDPEAGEDGRRMILETPNAEELAEVLERLESAFIPYAVEAGTALELLADRDAAFPSRALEAAAWRAKIWVQAASGAAAGRILSRVAPRARRGDAWQRFRRRGGLMDGDRAPIAPTARRRRRSSPSIRAPPVTRGPRNSRRRSPRRSRRSTRRCLARSSSSSTTGCANACCMSSKREWQGRRGRGRGAAPGARRLPAAGPLDPRFRGPGRRPCLDRRRPRILRTAAGSSPRGFPGGARLPRGRGPGRRRPGPGLRG